MIATLAVLLLSANVASARLPKRPLHWAGTNFAKHSQAVEHLTLRGADSRGNRTFIRYSMANAGYKKGKLTITVLQRTPAGTLYGKQTFKRGRYTVFRDHFGLRAGGNVMEVKGGKLMMTFQLKGVTGTAVMTPRGSGLSLKDRDSSGWLRRTLLSPWAKVEVDLRNPKGQTAKMKTTVFAVHEASTLKAHRTYDRVVQFHKVRGGRVAVVDYIVAPTERKHRPLGFVILRGGGQRFVGKVTEERRTAERLDKRNDYRVPWQIDVRASRRGKTADVRLTTSRQVSRKDDLAKMGFFARKAVGMLIHPYTYTLAGTWSATVQAAPTAPKTAAAAAAPAAAAPVAVTGKARFKYAQAR